MPQKRYLPDEIIAKPREAEVLLGQGRRNHVIGHHQPPPYVPHDDFTLGLARLSGAAPLR